MLTDQATAQIAAPAEVVYDLVVGVSSTAQCSPECPAWNGSASRPARSSGACFRGGNRWRGYTWWRQTEILQADRTTRVIESYLFRAPRWIQAMHTVLGRPKGLRRGMQRTLANLKTCRRTAGQKTAQQSTTQERTMTHDELRTPRDRWPALSGRAGADVPADGSRHAAPPAASRPADGTD
jgi:hypothetical protein